MAAARNGAGASLNALPAHLLFDVQYCRHQLRGRVRSFEGNCAIQEPGLIGEFDGLGFVKR
jgi:hypothetical protein